MLTHALDLLKGSWRYATGLRGFLSSTLDVPQAERVLREQALRREETFLRVLEGGVYARPDSPYRRLLLHAGFELDDVKALVRAEGLEGALSRLYDAGVYATLDEFKGRALVRRQGLEFEVSDRDFDNPLLTVHYEGRTGGSRGGGNRVPIDFDFSRHEGANTLFGMHATGVAGRPVVLCQSAPPSGHGIATMFRLSRAGHMPVRWFAPNQPGWNRQGLQARALMLFTLAASRLAGRQVPRPRHLKHGRADAVVEFLAQLVREGRPAVVFCVPGQSVRICLAATGAGIDISGTVFFGGGEPYTPGKSEVLRRAGATGKPTYGLNECGNLSFPCGNPVEPDDMHVMDEKVVILRRAKEVDSAPDVQAMYHTLLLTSAPKLMINVESGDYGTFETRDCGCAWEKLGFRTHLHSVRSYEKLNSDGVMFLGSMLYELLEERLPARFGGNPSDYQLVEEEVDGVPKVSLVVSPRLGPIDESAVLKVFVDGVGFADWSRRMADHWREGGTLRVQRREPYTTASAKILPLHVIPAASTPGEDQTSAASEPPP